MRDKAIALRNVEYFNELLSRETDRNRRTILLRLLADAEQQLRQADEQSEQEIGEQPRSSVRIGERERTVRKPQSSQ
jgi:hypothetical protein